MSDIAGVLPGGTVIVVECKMPQGRLTATQRSFLDAVRLKGGVALCVRSVEELEAALSQTMVHNRRPSHP